MNSENAFRRWRCCLGIIVALLAVAGPHARANEPVAPKIQDALQLPPPGSVVFQGRLGAALALCETNRLLAQNVPDLIAPFADRQEDWSWRCEFWGKWYTSVALAYRYQPEPRLRTVLDEAAQKLLATQAPNGSLTTYQPAAEFSNWDTWGRKYTLLGLLADYDRTGDPQVLAAACRHADVVREHFGPGRADLATNGWWNGMAASSILEPMVLLYRRTGDARYLQFAEYIVQSWQNPGGADLVRKAMDGVPVFKMFPGPDSGKEGYMAGGSSKAYEMMSCYEGLLELYRVTGETNFLTAARNVFANIRDTEITVIGSGSSWERWCHGRMRQTEAVPYWMETCVTTYWLKLAAQLLRITGDPAYADQIEVTAYNALLGAQKADGSWWCHYSPLNGVRDIAEDQCGMHQDCCVANGPRGLLLLPELAVMRGPAGPVVNFYEPATATLPLANGKTVHLEIKSDYPRSGVVDLVVRPEATARFTLSLRIPAWSRTTRVEINGRAQSDIWPGSYARLKRKWRPGDRVRVTFDFATRMVPAPGGSGAVALVRGPAVLALDKRLLPASPDAGFARVQADAAGVVQATEVRDGLPAGMAAAWDIPFTTADGKQVILRFCDYASAGATWSEASALRVWLPQPLNLAEPFANAPTPGK